MSIVQPSIRSWSDGYRALRKQAEAHRGVILLNPDFADTASWPRTTGLDVLAISAVFDGAVRAQVSPAAGQRWFQAWFVETDLLAREPQETLTDTYASNRSFWSTLAGVATLLDHLQAALPEPEAWNAALRQLAAERDARRNGPPLAEDVTAEFPRVGSWDEMADLQLRFFRALRGEELADGPLLVRIPRTTNADVLQLATYWTEQLARSASCAAIRYRHVYTHWGAALVDVSRHAQGASPHAIFPCNREFWHALYILATQAEASVEPLSPWTIHVQAIADHAEPLRNAAPIERAETIEFPAAASWDEAARMQRDYFVKLRGEDIVPGGLAVHVPRTTNSDVTQLAAYWSKALARVGEHNFADISYRHIINRWKAAVADVEQLTRGAEPTAIYPRNAEFWAALLTIALQVAVTDEAPSRWTLVKETVHNLPQNISDAIAKLPDVVSKVADAGKKTLIEGLARPLVFVGGGILALSLLLRSSRGDRSDRSGS